LDGQVGRFPVRLERWPRGSHGGLRPLGILTQIMELRDPASAQHSRAVAGFAHRVGSVMGLAGEALAELEMAASFHDLGKSAIPDRVLQKPGALDPSEWRVMRSHAEAGAELLRYLPDCAAIAPIVRHHHERWDGYGYPDRLREDETPLASRIIAVCDAYAAMLADRPYRRALHPIVARQELTRGAGSQFDSDVVEALLTALEPPLARVCG
jgi:HD-GYP domain-containing protein (c-di-GMP phosphodiesterase class II)